MVLFCRLTGTIFIRHFRRQIELFSCLVLCGLNLVRRCYGSVPVRFRFGSGSSSGLNSVIHLVASKFLNVFIYIYINIHTLISYFPSGGVEIYMLNTVTKLE